MFVIKSGAGLAWVNADGSPMLFETYAEANTFTMMLNRNGFLRYWSIHPLEDRGSVDG